MVVDLKSDVVQALAVRIEEVVPDVAGGAMGEELQLDAVQVVEHHPDRGVNLPVSVGGVAVDVLDAGVGFEAEHPAHAVAGGV
nr:hypothetical protein [Streptomyces sp. CL12-4]